MSKKQQHPVEVEPLFLVGATFVVLIIEGARLFPLLDFNAEPIGARYPVKVFDSAKSAATYAALEGYQYFITTNIDNMAKGTIFYAEITISYRSGRSKDRKTSKIKTSCVGYSGEDALERLKANPQKVASRAKKQLGKVRDLAVTDLRVIHESGSTMYDIDTGKAF